MHIGSGDKPVSEYRSFVLYHSNSPQWNETIKVSWFLDVIEFEINELESLKAKFGQIRLFDGTVQPIKLEEQHELGLITISNEFYLFAATFYITWEI